MKLTNIDVENRRKIAEQARLIAKSSDGVDISSYAYELKERYVCGEISMDERKTLLLKHYNIILE